MISLRSTITQKVLGYMFLNPSVRHHVSELARVLSVDGKNLHRKLVELEQHGLLKSEFSGKQRYFFLNDRFPLLKEYRSISRKSFGLQHRIAARLREVEGVEAAYIFGSYARDVMDEASDIDLLVVGDHSPRDLSRVLLPVQRENGRVINPINMTQQELKCRRRRRDPLLRSIFGAGNLQIV